MTILHKKIVFLTYGLGVYNVALSSARSIINSHCRLNSLMNQTAERLSGAVDDLRHFTTFSFSKRRQHIIDDTDPFGRTTYS